MRDTRQPGKVALPLVVVVLVPECDMPLLLRYEATGAYVACLNEAEPKRDAVRLLCAVLENRIKQIGQTGEEGGDAKRP